MILAFWSVAFFFFSFFRFLVGTRSRIFNFYLCYLFNVRQQTSMASPKQRGCGKNKRIWKEEEDNALIEVLKDLVIGGTSFKADNGFKPRFLKTVEEALRAKLPVSGLKVILHIHSWVWHFRRVHSIIHDMVVGSYTSGIRDETIVAEKEEWRTYLKVCMTKLCSQFTLSFSVSLSQEVQTAGFSYKRWILSFMCFWVEWYWMKWCTVWGRFFCTVGIGDWLAQIWKLLTEIVSMEFKINAALLCTHPCSF